MNPEQKPLEQFVPARHDDFDAHFNIEDLNFLEYVDLGLSQLIAAELFQVEEMLIDGPTFAEPPVPTTLIEIINKRYSQPVGNGSNPVRFMELYGAKEVPVSAIEPDPATARGDFYYNSRHNRLYKKLKTKPKPVWKVVS